MTLPLAEPSRFQALLAQCVIYAHLYWTYIVVAFAVGHASMGRLRMADVLFQDVSMPESTRLGTHTQFNKRGEAAILA